MRPIPKFDPARAKRALMDLAITGDASSVIKKYDITIQTLNRWKKQLEKDPDIKSVQLALKSVQACSGALWVELTGKAISVLISKTIDLADKCNDPKQLGVISDALKTLTETHMAGLSLMKLDEDEPQKPAEGPGKATSRADKDSESIESDSLF